MVIKGIVPSDGNPEKLISANVGALFSKSGSIYKVNYGGMSSSLWQNVTFDPFGKSPVFLTETDLNSVPTPDTGSYLYVKRSGVAGLGWSLLEKGKLPFIPII